MSDPRAHADRDDRDRNRITRDDVGTASSASIEGDAPEGTTADAGISTAGGAAGGAAAGMTAGMVTLGPIGSIIGAIAGAVGGGWAGLASGRGGDTAYSSDDDATYRAHYDADDARLADRSFEDSRLAYQLGHFAAVNPDYEGRPYEEIESDLRRGWTPDVEARHGSWDHASRYARAAYQARRARPIGRGFVDLEMGGTETHRRPSFADPIPPGDPDGVLGEPPRAEGRE